MIRGQIKARKEIRAQDWLTDIGDNKSEVEFSVLDPDFAVREAIAGYIRAVRCLELPGVRTSCLLLRGRRDDGPEGPTIDQPSCSVVRVGGMEEGAAAFEIAGKGGIYFCPAFPFPVGLFSGYRMHPAMQLKALSPYLS